MHARGRAPDVRCSAGCRGSGLRRDFPNQSLPAVPPVQEEQILTQHGGIFIKDCGLRGRTGGVEVDVLSSAVPALYSCSDVETLKAQIAAPSLTSTKVRFNARGVVRCENGVAGGT